MTARYLVGDIFDRLKELPDNSVDLVVTSPPFLALRSYLPADHPDKAKEIGSEPTPAEWLDTMLAIYAELRRVVADHGSVVFEVGDTYAGSGGGGGDYLENGWREGQQQFAGSGASMRESNAAHWRQKNQNVDAWPLAKSKALIPQLLEIALAYGFNPLTGAESPAGKWRVRNVVSWVRPNPPVGALGDKWRPATSDVIVACTSAKRYWDDLATRKPSDYHRESLYVNKETPPGQRPNMSQHTVNGGGAPLLDYWEIPPGGYKGSHYAVFPPELVVPLVKAMCPRKVCVTCGEPERRIVERERTSEADDSTRIKHANGERPHEGRQDRAPEVGWEYDRQTTGFTDCGHNTWRNGVVLDPFAGSGTTLMVATGHGHNAIGIDIDSRNAELAMERVGPFLMEVSA